MHESLLIPKEWKTKVRFISFGGRIWLSVAWLLGGCLSMSMLSGPSHAAYPPAVGERHPDFTLPAVHGAEGPVSLSDFRGQKVLLIHFASW